MVLPVVERELRVASRRRSTYRTRLIAVVLMLAGFGFAEIDFLNRNPSAAEQGRLLFQIFSWLAFVFAALAGLIGTADCMSSEKREGTLGLLFLTDLKGYDVICGKLAANSVSVIYGLVASVPILSLPIIMGGVGPM
ncbi:MAG: ABC transporter permease, partial [Limisphaerales bacterium]